MDDLDGFIIFDENMEAIDDEEVDYILEEYNLTRAIIKNGF